MNIVVIRGTLSSAPREQDLPSGSLLIAWEVSVRDAAGSASSVPVRWFDPPSRLRSVDAGDEVVVVGSVRRRFYRAGGRTMSATEVVGRAASRAGRPAEVARLLARAIAEMEPAEAA